MSDVIRDGAIYVSSKTRRCLVLVAQRRRMEGANADAIADEILREWFANNPEGKSVLEFVENQDEQRKTFVNEVKT